MNKLTPPKPINLQKPCIACSSSRGMVYFLHEKHNGFIRCNRCDVALRSATDEDLEVLANVQPCQECDQ
ncbi:hypothetical protein [Anabaena sp. CCY 0017]|uniref:hypothetical protein n=1 Tax=Anabaena sp. CCY 0017 TaxID=3103866 RepID=UPI0039C6F777